MADYVHEQYCPLVGSGKATAVGDPGCNCVVDVGASVRNAHVLIQRLQAEVTELKRVDSTVNAPSQVEAKSQLCDTTAIREVLIEFNVFLHERRKQFSRVASDPEEAHSSAIEAEAIADEYACMISEFRHKVFRKFHAITE